MSIEFRINKKGERFDATKRAGRARDRSPYPRTGVMTFGTWAAEWLSSDPAKSPSAWARDDSILRTHLLPALGRRRLDSISQRDVQALITTWSTRAKPRTVRRQYDTLRAILNAAVRADLIARSPCRAVRLPKWRREIRPVLGADDLARLATAMCDLGLMTYLGAVLGLRWGEVAGLRVGALDFPAKRITVVEQRTRGVQSAMVVRQPKSEAGRRTLSAPDWLMDRLAEHLAARHVTAADRDALVFVAATGEGLDYGNWRHRTWIPATRQAGFVGLQFHDLRRTASTALVQEHVDMKTAQTRLGHADPRTTLAIYAQATKDADRKAAERLGARFRPPGATTPKGTASRAARGIHAG
ncbi:MAG: site-specific integrase [Acidimicrobiaceae bacterium]|nr:site-specific integrase [Acidimicrobiaceae bacterium]